ncbi:hypothetical protein KIN20_000216 [Parelaphostrongylus tenuis]|uniref:Uncharacterized protein n=1 Tax=Parelaphostrongylus tenuis TaxID=148309 RepID=A0AAD5QDM5_PARTN|nr:hypothetical protein KIN20_000216 [Parelaphostrongylus tenuis]
MTVCSAFAPRPTLFWSTAQRYVKQTIEEATTVPHQIQWIIFGGKHSTNSVQKWSKRADNGYQKVILNGTRAAICLKFMELIWNNVHNL